MGAGGRQDRDDQAAVHRRVVAAQAGGKRIAAGVGKPVRRAVREHAACNSGFDCRLSEPDQLFLAQAARRPRHRLFCGLAPDGKNGLFCAKQLARAAAHLVEQGMRIALAS